MPGAGENVARDSLCGQRRRHGCGEAHGIQRTMHLEGQPGGLELNGPALGAGHFEFNDDGRTFIFRDEGSHNR